MKTWLSADYHFGEDRFQILGRPFKEIDEAIETIVKNHNEVVAPDDKVIVVGDVVYKERPEYLHHVGRMNGVKTLIRGNHDANIPDSDFLKYFTQVVPEGTGIYVAAGNDIPCYVTHYPTGGLPNHFNLVGHIHAAWKYQLNMLNVGVDVHHFRPVDLDSIPFHFKAVCEFYDEDVWVAYEEINLAYCNIRGKKGRYFSGK